MAKKTATNNATTAALGEVSAKVRKAVEAIRRPFTAFVDDFRMITESRAELAPKFMKAFGLWQTEVGGSFIDFCRILVPDIPAQSRTTADGPGYRDHAAYQAADYLRRLAAQAARAETTPAERAQRIADAPVTPTTAVARLLKAIMPLLQAQQTASLFDALRTQLHWPDRTVTRIQTETQRVEPLVVLREPRGLHALGNLRLAMPAPAAAEEMRTGTQG